MNQAFGNYFTSPLGEVDPTLRDRVRGNRRIPLTPALSQGRGNNFVRCRRIRLWRKIP